MWTKANNTEVTNTAGIDKIALQADLQADRFESQQTPTTVFQRVESVPTKIRPIPNQVPTGTKAASTARSNSSKTIPSHRRPADNIDVSQIEDQLFSQQAGIK